MQVRPLLFAASVFLNVGTAAHTPVKMVFLAEPRSAVRATLGTPRTSKGLMDVYRFKSRENEFEEHVEYEIDSSASRLHPVVRVDDVVFIPDRAQTWKKIALQIPEIKFRCALGCVTVAAFAKNGNNVDKLDTFIVGCRAHDDDPLEKWWEARNKGETCFRITLQSLPDQSLEDNLDWDQYPVDDVTLEWMVPSDPTISSTSIFVRIESLGVLQTDLSAGANVLTP
jgi:hypothetical protein